MFAILNEIKDNAPRKYVISLFALESLYSHALFRTTGVIAASIGSAASIYILVAVTGYLSFGNNVLGNIVGMCKCNRRSYLDES
jgi:amino acid permease